MEPFHRVGEGFLKRRSSSMSGHSGYQLVSDQRLATIPLSRDRGRPGCQV